MVCGFCLPERNHRHGLITQGATSLTFTYMSSRPLIQGRAQILLGDTTSHGGVVISGSATTTVEGRPIARVGDLVTCPLCKPHTFPIVEGLSTLTDNYMAVALHGHKIACGATLIASSNNREE